MNTKLAEFVGIMLGDGYISNKDHRLKISFNSLLDIEYLNYVNNLIKDLFNVKTIVKHRKNENTSDLFVFNRVLIRKILGFGLIESPKWKRAEIPSNLFRECMYKHILRGYFDTDGCLAIVNNNGIRYPRIEMKVCPSPMQNQFVKMLDYYHFRFGIYHIGKGEVRIQLNGKSQTSKWFSLVGSNNPKHLKKYKSIAGEGFEPPTSAHEEHLFSSFRVSQNSL